MALTALPLSEIERFLHQRHGGPISDLAPLEGGFWSSALAYRVNDEELVVRFGDMREGFEADRRAMAYAGPDLPVPSVREIGDAFGASYAISERRHGRFLESIEPGEAHVARLAIGRLLAALRAVPEGAPETETSWRRRVLDGLIDFPDQRTAGWRATLAADVALDQLFTACEARVAELIDACPERRDLLHGDLLHRNVLISEDASSVAAVFSWKCSQRGDFLYDTAWCTFWSHLFPGVAAADVWGLVPAGLPDAATRHHCYELQIGASHLGWHAWTGETDALRSVAAHTAMLLERGPLPPSTGD